MFSFYRQVRLAGVLLLVVGANLPNLNLFVIGVMTLFIGIVNGLIDIEHRLDVLEKEKSNEKVETPENR